MEIKDLSLEVNMEEVRGGQWSFVGQGSYQVGGNTIANSVNTLGLGNNVLVGSNISNDQASVQTADVDQVLNVLHQTTIANSLFADL